MPTDADQMIERAEKVAAAVHSGRLEGVEPSPAFIMDAQAYVAGDIDAEEVVRRARKRYGLD